MQTRLEKFKGKTLKETFTLIFETRDWQKTEDIESVSGKGSTLAYTENIRKELPLLFKEYNIKSLLDLGCGDLNWIKELLPSFDNYLGIDIVNDLILENRKKYGNSKISFSISNIVKYKPIFNFDAVLIKDVYVHLTNKQILSSLENIKNSGIKYLIATNFKSINNNIDLEIPGLWRPINLLCEPFCLKKLVYSISEPIEKYVFLNEEYNDKQLSIWKIND
jgi:SAM-dependent methyltransferase